MFDNSQRNKSCIPDWRSAGFVEKFHESDEDWDDETRFFLTGGCLILSGLLLEWGIKLLPNAQGVSVHTYAVIA